MRKQPRDPEPVKGHCIDTQMPLHQMFIRRMRKGRDLKVIITARNSSTGTGKTTLAAWLAMQWNPIFTGNEWSAEEQAALSAQEYLDTYRDLPYGSVLLMDEAEQLDSRRSMSGENVDFSHKWMMMRVRQVVSILTLPTVNALDSRLEELADVWINVERRGKATVHAIQVQSYFNKKVQTPKEHTLTWPDISDHPEMQTLDELKEDMIEGVHDDGKTDDEDEDDGTPTKQAQKFIAQALRDRGLSYEKIAEDERIEFSDEWCRQHTTDTAGDKEGRTV